MGDSPRVTSAILFLMVNVSKTPLRDVSTPSFQFYQPVSKNQGKFFLADGFKGQRSLYLYYEDMLECLIIFFPKKELNMRPNSGRAL